MGVPLGQKYTIAAYLFRRKLRGERRTPLVLMLEPLFRCNLACAGCGKIAYPQEILNRRLTPEECLSAAMECGAPVVSIAGGEPLIHPELPEIAAQLVKRKKFVYLCTNGLLLEEQSRGLYPLLAPHILDPPRREEGSGTTGSRDDRGYSRPPCRASKPFGRGGFGTSSTAPCMRDGPRRKLGEFFDFISGLGVEGITVSPGFSYSGASGKDLFLNRTRSKQLFREVLKLWGRRGWKFNHSSLFLDFLAGNRSYSCTPWGNPTRNVLGWQRPCYLLAEGHVPSYRALEEETDWARYGPGRHSKCAQCMLHSGFEATAVNDTLAPSVPSPFGLSAGPENRGAVRSGSRPGDFQVQGASPEGEIRPARRPGELPGEHSRAPDLSPNPPARPA